MLVHWVPRQWIPGNLGELLLDSGKPMANLDLFGGSWIIKKNFMVFCLGVTLYHIICLLSNEDVLMKPHPLFRREGRDSFLNSSVLARPHSAPTWSLA